MEKIIDINEDLKLEDFYDKRYISRVSEEELKTFVRNLYKTSMPNYHEVVDPHVKPKVVAGKEYAYEYYPIYWIVDEVRLSELRGGVPKVRFFNTEIKMYPEERDKEVTIGYPSYREAEGNELVFHDYSFYNKNSSFLGSWKSSPYYLNFMYHKFGEQYRNDLLGVRELYKQYYIARENAKLNEGIAVMQKHVFPRSAKQQKTTNSFVESVPLEVLDQYHWYINDNRPNVIRVTNFQTLKNEDIPEENKSHAGSTELVRHKNRRFNDLLISDTESQDRVMKQKWYRDDDGKLVIEHYYPKKNSEIFFERRVFDDFGVYYNRDREINESIYKIMLKTGRAEENDYIWRGCMYSYFGEEYMQAVKDLESKKINDYIESFDKKTTEIKEMFSSFSQKDNLLSSSEYEME